MGGVLRNAIQNSGGGGGGGGSVESVSGNIVDNTDAANPVVTQVQPDWNATSGLASIQNKPNSNSTINYVVNGTLAIDTINAGAFQGLADGISSMNYVADMAFGGSTGGNFPIGQQIPGELGDKAYRITGQAGVSTAFFGIRIPNNRVAYLQGKKATMSVYMKSTSAAVTSVDYEVSTADGENNFGTIGAPNYTPIPTTGSGTVALTSTLTRIVVPLGLMPANVENGIQILFTVGALESDAWTIEQICFNEGTTAIDFPVRFEQDESTYCLPFRFKSWYAGLAPTGLGVGGGVAAHPVSVAANNAVCNYRFPWKMAYTPTVILYDDLGAAGTVTQPGFANGLDAVAINITPNGFDQILATNPFVVGDDIKAGVYAYAPI